LTSEICVSLSLTIFTLKRAAGWIYTLLWSLSFYPQPILNWQRRSTQGFTIDFPTLNVLGFFCYSTSTCFFLYSSTIRQQYAARHPLAPEPTVRFNDAAFGIHAVIIVLLTYSQFFPRLWGFKGSDRARTSRPVLGIFWGSVIAIIAVSGLVYFNSAAHPQGPQDWEWIDVVCSHPLVVPPPCAH
jgi:cystinosin